MIEIKFKAWHKKDKRFIEPFNIRDIYADCYCDTPWLSIFGTDKESWDDYELITIYRSARQKRSGDL